MPVDLVTKAEESALKAEQLSAFSGVKLLHIKREVAKLLQLIGREGIFAQHTAHDISHADEMLRILDWLVPPSTNSSMTPADWLMTVLAIYFHDLGLLVTSHEFEHRYESDFRSSVRKVCSPAMPAPTTGPKWRPSPRIRGSDFFRGPAGRVIRSTFTADRACWGPRSGGSLGPSHEESVLDYRLAAV